ncbi:MAG: ComF family protein [Candidatus Omnitrophica bacterium]|nr:ComF family protein [Candidatus Omnitrophota bacterium]
MLKKYISALKDILVPRICFACEEKIPEGYLCLKCLQNIEFINPPFCTFCGCKLSAQEERICLKCAKIAFPYEKLICVTKYKSPMVELIHLFKYKNYDFLVELLAALMIVHLKRIGFEASGCDFMTAVPLYKTKLRDRGYNQAGLLAQYLANYFKISFKNDIIYATRESLSQAKLDKKSRLTNIKGIFNVRNNLENKKVILLDDIFTTGSTVSECANALKEKGARVTIMTLSKT